MHNRHFVYTFLLIFALLSREAYAQSFSVRNALELFVAAGAALYPVNNKALWVPEPEEISSYFLGQSELGADIADVIDLPDEDECSDTSYTPLKGSAGGMQVSVCDDRAAFRLSDKALSDYSDLSQTMKKHNLYQVSVQPGQVDIFTKETAEPSISVDVPFIDEPTSLITEHEWLEDYRGLAYVTLHTMETVATIVEKAWEMQPIERHKGLEQEEPVDEVYDETVWFDVDELGGMLYAMEPVPETPLQSQRIDTLQEFNLTFIELDFGTEIIQV